MFVESSLKYHSNRFEFLTSVHDLDQGQCLVGSLTGAVASQKVTEAREGKLKLVRNQLLECNGISLPDCKADRPSRNESWS